MSYGHQMKKAFSLIELSLVVIVIGLIIAGLTSGSKLIYQAKLKSIVDQTNDIEAALRIFLAKYDALPGDMADAEDYWGTYNSSSNPTGTTNGNGNFHIAYNGSGVERENFRAWQQLSKAGFLEGEYSGVEGSSGTFTIGTQIPKSKFKDDIGISFYPYSTTKDISSNWYSQGGLFVRMGKKVSWDSTSQEHLYLSAFSSNQILLFDKKFDDGIGYAGDFRGAPGGKADGSGYESASHCTSFSSTTDSVLCIIARRYGWLIYK